MTLGQRLIIMNHLMRMLAVVFCMGSVVGSLRAAETGKYIDIHVHCHALKEVDLEKVSEWMRLSALLRSYPIFVMPNPLA